MTHQPIPSSNDLVSGRALTHVTYPCASVSKLKLIIAFTSIASACLAQTAAPTHDIKSDKPEKNYLIGGQITAIAQSVLPFRSPYSGQNSFESPSRFSTEWTDTYTLYLGYRPTPGVELYVDPEMARGAGVGGAVGLAGFPNGDVLRVPGFGIGALPETPYLGRYFVRAMLSTGHGTTKISAGENQIAGTAPTERLVLTAGKVAVPDIFDANSYASSTRTQFMNWALINNAAYDYAADTRGYSDGVALEWVHPTWTLRAGLFEMPIVPNGPTLATHWSQDRGDQVEAEVHPQALKGKDPAVVRLLVYRNTAHMGNYAQAIQQGLQAGTPPNITATEKDGAIKYGFGLNMEQAVADDGDTGVFARFGWDDGATESFAYTECDDHIALGAQISGKRWKLSQDRIGVALVSDGLSGPHRQYLADGGTGFLLGDGKLNYGRETVVETYYQRQLSKFLAATLDFQLIANPGYNQDRGPISLITARLHYEF